MAFLTGLLMALGRLSGDREAVALLACGVSPLRLLRPVLLMGVARRRGWTCTCSGQGRARLQPALPGRDLPAGPEQGEGDIKPGVFYEGFPGKVLYVREVARRRLDGVMLADTQPAGPPVVTLAEQGRLD